MSMIALDIDGAWLYTSKVHNDERGNFREWFKLSEISSLAGINFKVAQANTSQSKRGVIRGIHYSLAPEGQAKWITCTSGEIRDVIVDIRRGSPTYGKSVVINLSANSGDAILLGAGLGHGFSAMEEGTTVVYLVSSEYSPQHEFSINPLDSDLKIDWGFTSSEIQMSPSDSAAPSFRQRADSGLLPSIS